MKSGRAGPPKGGGGRVRNADRTGLLLRLSNGQVDLTLDLGSDAAAQLRQALSWASSGTHQAV